MDARHEADTPAAMIATDALGQVLFWVVGAAVSIAVALAILWLLWSLVTRIRG